ncbi:MAG: T9SS type A sorting domain-containing protein [Muribaculaceae bacterium]|nr:T9SS type A sorting domain-containing protein [Muribaculaceae bacterium]
MKRSTLSILLGATLLTTIGTTASATPIQSLKGKEIAPFSRMRKAEPTQRWSAPNVSGQRQQRVSPHFTTPASDSFEYLYAPDGSIWYAVCTYDTEKIEYEYYTERILKGFTFTFYDDKFNEIGKVRDKIELEEGEIKCVQAALGSQVTKQFFNYDGNYEVMVSFAMNTPENVNNIRTKAYSITNLEGDALSAPLTVMPGYPVDAVNCAKDRWSEDYYVTFLTEEQAGDPDDYTSYIDFLGAYNTVLTTYGKGNKLVMEKKIRLLDLPGDQMNAPMMLCKNENGRLTLIYSRYEKSFFEDPSGMGGNENVTKDNNLIIEIYQMNDSYPSEMELVGSTKIETVQHTDNPDVYCTYYSIGNLMWDKDVDFSHYTSDGKPSFIVSVDDYLYSDDDHLNSSYYVYDADGNRIKTIAENTYDFVSMSDIAGFEPQTMFIHMGDDMNFEFVDLYSCKTVTKVDQMFQGYGLSVSTDRIPSGDSYVYGSALSTGVSIDDTHIGAPVCWIDTNGDLVRLDVIPTGEGVELAQIYMVADGLGQYIFNTDTDFEYVMLVKRNVPGERALREELLIASPEKGVLNTFTAEEGKGYIRSVLLMAGANPELIVVYITDDYEYTADAYSLPFSKFAGGNGTLSDPYLIATAGDLQQIKSAPSASFKLTDDIDCSNLDFYPIEEFSGTLDGDGHTVSNLKLVTKNNSKTGIFNFTNKATIKNIDFYNAKMILSGGYEAGLITATSANSTFDNIHVRRLTATGNDFSGEFGGIAGKMWTMSAISGCEVAGADINLPSCPSAGGMSGDIRTGCTITGCAFSGNMTANNTLGGIVGSTTTGDEVISQCHVDANLKAENTIGGIVGFLDRSKVKSNYVEGTLEATKPSKWNNAISIGGIAGELEGDWQGKADVPVVFNLIGISAMIYPDMSGITEQYPRQLSTMHRVIGRSSYNSYFEEDPNKIVYENGVYNNYIVSDLAAIDQDFAERSLEGTTIDKNEVDQDMLQNQLGFEYGTTNDAPWNIQSWYDYDPSLYYESMAYIPTKTITVDKGSTFSIDIAVISREALTEQSIIEDFMCEFNEDILNMTGNMNFDGKTLKVEFNAINSGESVFTVSILNGKASCVVKVNDNQASVDGIESVNSTFSIQNGIVSAEGCSIAIYDINGKAMLSGHDTVDTNSLTAGIYVATATDKAGKTTAKKFVK